MSGNNFLSMQTNDKLRDLLYFELWNEALYSIMLIYDEYINDIVIEDNEYTTAGKITSFRAEVHIRDIIREMRNKAFVHGSTNPMICPHTDGNKARQYLRDERKKSQESFALIVNEISARRCK